MKKLLSMIAVLAISMSVIAQQMHVWSNNMKVLSMDLAEVDSITFEPNKSETITAIRIIPDNYQMSVGKAIRLIVVVEPTTIVEIPPFKWMSSNTEVATVDDSGIVTARGIGNTIITATVEGMTNIMAFSQIRVNSSIEELDDTLTVAQAIQNQDGVYTKCVKGYIVGWYNNHKNAKQVEFGAEDTADTTVIASNIVIADNKEETDAAKTVCVQLPKGEIREALNLAAHKDNLGATVIVKGRLAQYNAMAGVREISEAWLNGKKVGTVDITGDLTVKEGQISIEDLLEEIKTLASGATTEKEYSVVGQVKSIKSVDLFYGNAEFTITDGTNDFLCYRVYDLENSKFVNVKNLQVGHAVVVKGKIKNYNGTIAMVSSKEDPGYVFENRDNPTPFTAEEVKTITVKEAIDIANALPADGFTNQYRIKGTISKVKDASTIYGNITVEMQDEEGRVFIAYRVKYLGGKTYTADDPYIEVGDEITVFSQILNYKGNTPETLPVGYIETHNGNSTPATP